MNNLVVIYMTIFIIVAICLMAFAIFALGFLVGYKREEKKILKRKQQYDSKEYKNDEKEKKTKKEWKKFLEYDGSVPEGY